MAKKILTVLLFLIFIFILAWWYFGFSLDFMHFWAAEPGALEVSPSPSVISESVSVICDPSSTATPVGQAVTLTATGGQGPYAWFAPQAEITQGADASHSQISLVYKTTGTKKVTVQAQRSDGSQNTDSVACTVIVQ